MFSSVSAVQAAPAFGMHITIGPGHPHPPRAVEAVALAAERLNGSTPCHWTLTGNPQPARPHLLGHLWRQPPTSPVEMDLIPGCASCPRQSDCVQRARVEVNRDVTLLCGDARGVTSDGDPLVEPRKTWPWS